MLQETLSEIRGFTQCVGVGIRILDKYGNIPCEAHAGFSREFYERESPLAVKNDPCMCIRVIGGQTDPTLPFFMPGGSFYINNNSSFLALASEQDKERIRTVCGATGFESVALIPIRSNGDILGLIHLADSRDNRMPPASSQ